MNKAIAIFFLCFFFLSQTAHYIIYYVQRCHIKNMARQEILAGVPDRYLKIIEFNKDIEWEDEEKEFSLNGEFYDIVKIKKREGKTFLYCINDENEEQLVRKFSRAIKSSADGDTGKDNKHSFKSQIMDQLAPWLRMSLVCKNLDRQKYFYFYTAALASNCKEIIIPPPWMPGYHS